MLSTDENNNYIITHEASQDALPGDIEKISLNCNRS